MAGNRVVRFFIPANEKKPNVEKDRYYTSMLPAKWTPVDRMPDVHLFGDMRLSYLQDLISVVRAKHGIKLQHPETYKYPGLHGKKISMTYMEFLNHMRDQWGELKHAPKSPTYSMEALLESIQQKLGTPKTVRKR